MATTTTTTQKAVVAQGPGHAELVSHHPIPTPRDDFIRVRTVAVALNPTDWKHLDRGLVGTLVGCDYAGVVEAVGKNVTKDFQAGDRVYGPVHGSDFYRPENGAFAQHIVAKGDLQLKVPANLGFERAATLPIGILTVCQGLYLHLNLASPTAPIKDRTPILIYGGSSATGSLGIQFARLSGYEPITVCSRANFDFVQSVGAAAAFDYHDPDCGKKIREHTRNKLRLAWDTISQPDTARICAEALSSSSSSSAADDEGTKYYYTILPVDSPRQDVETKSTMAYFMLGETMQLDPKGPVQDPDLESYEFAKSFLPIANQLIAEGKIQTHPPRVGGDGLKGTIDGLKLMKEGKVSAAKLVYRVEDTP